MWQKQVTCDVGTTQCEDETVKCNKITIMCDIGTAQYEDKTVKYEIK